MQAVVLLGFKNAFFQPMLAHDAAKAHKSVIRREQLVVHGRDHHRALASAGEPFLRRTYIFCQRDAAALPQVQLFMDMLKKKR